MDIHYCENETRRNKIIESHWEIKPQSVHKTMRKKSINKSQSPRIIKSKIKYSRSAANIIRPNHIIKNEEKNLYDLDKYVVRTNYFKSISPKKSLIFPRNRQSFDEILCTKCKKMISIYNIGKN